MIGTIQEKSHSIGGFKMIPLSQEVGKVQITFEAMGKTIKL
jgi:hypothetical protein